MQTVNRTGFRYCLKTWRLAFYCILTASLLCLIPTAHGADKTIIRVGVFDNNPIVFQAAPGQYAGLAVDLLESVAAQENWQINYVFGPWKEVLAKLDKGDIDLLVGIAYNAERARRYDYTQETLINNWGTIYRNPTSPISSLADLQGKRVALMSGSIHTLAFKNIMSRFQFDFETLEVDDYHEAMRAVSDGRADAAVVNRVISLLHANEYGLLETGIIFNPVEVRYATLKGRAGHILAAIDKHLATQKQDKSSTYYSSMDRWLHINTATRLPAWLHISAIVAAIIVTILGISNLLIRKKVAARTAELTESELRFRQLAENINEVFWVGSPDWQQVYYVSPAFETVFNQPREALYANGRLWLEAVHPEDRELVLNDLQRKVAGNLHNPAFPDYRIISATGIRWILARAYPIRDERGTITRIVGIAEDITERKQAYETIDFMAHHDPLTRLTNRFAFEKSLGKLMSDSDWQTQSHALMYLDLDQFKIVNDTCGHAAGDQMLIDLTRLLKKKLNNRGLLARLGGDEFGLILQDTNLQDASELARQLLEAIQAFRFEWDDQKFSVGASIGLVIIDNSEMSQAELLSAADMACYAAKETGRNRLHLYTPDDAHLLQRHGEMQWVNRLKAALEDNRFVLYKQTIRPLQKDNQHQSCDEYLFRMLDENNKVIMPGAFIPAAERYELMPQLDRWVVSNVIAHLKDSNRRQDRQASVAFINLSGQIFTDDRFIDFLMQQLAQHNIDPSSICLEITETAAISNLDKAINFIQTLRDRGLHFALDDFGSGMSSFSYLKFLPVDYLKIDGVFIRDLLVDPMNTSIVDAITHIGHAANLKVIAEWVEDDQVLGKLTDMGIDFAQGYAIDKPAQIASLGAVV